MRWNREVQQVEQLGIINASLQSLSIDINESN